MIRGSNSLRIIRRQNLVLDPKLIRENPEIVKHATLAKRVASPELVDAWLPEGVTREQVLEAMQPLLELPVELVLPTHGPPTERAALERALAA